MKGDYQPKVGDRVTVAGDDLEWVVDFVARDHVDIAAVVDRARWGLSVLPSMLTPVPTPPPEPPRPALVMYLDRPYARSSLSATDAGWPHLIDPADPAQVRDAGLCRVDEVRDWLFKRYPTHTTWQEFHEQFLDGVR